MTHDQILQCVDVLNELTKHLAELPEEQSKALAAGCQLAIAATYLTEMGAHMAQGMEPYDALVASLRGELRLS